LSRQNKNRHFIRQVNKPFCVADVTITGNIPAGMIALGAMEIVLQSAGFDGEAAGS
jgi:hypothetical protein